MRVLLLVICSLLVGSMRAVSEASPNFTHGTINVLVSDRNGTVLLTDSRISHRDSRKAVVVISDHAQKLFQLDSKTICSIANFYSAGLPALGNQVRPNGFPALFVSIDGLIQTFSREHNPTLTVRQKGEALAAFVGYFLVELAAERKASSFADDATSFQQELIVVGYDADGSETALKRTVTVTAANPNNSSPWPFTYHVDQGETDTLGKQFVKILGGVKDFANPRLERPERYVSEKELRAYRVAHKHHKRSKLSLAQLEGLARYLKTKSESGAEELDQPVIGGDIQMATLLNGKVELIPPQHPFDYQPPATESSFVINSHTSALMPQFGSAQFLTVVINSTCNAPGSVMLDNKVLLGGVYDHCNFFFNDRAFYLDPNNVTIKAATLIIGPRWNDQVVDFAVSSLPQDTRIVCWKDFVVPQDFQRTLIWNVGYTDDMVLAAWNNGGLNSQNIVSTWKPQHHSEEQNLAIRLAEARCAR